MASIEVRVDLIGIARRGMGGKGRPGCPGQRRIVRFGALVAHRFGPVFQFC